MGLGDKNKGQHRDRSNVKPSLRVELDADDKRLPKGGYCQAVYEPIPAYFPGGCENIIKGDNNAFIILGRDRPEGTASGYGGAGAYNCGMIDMIVGMDNCNVRKPYVTGDDPEKLNEKEAQALSETVPYSTSPSTFGDAARIYLTQKGDVDYYFGLANGTLLPGETKDSSGAVIKADHVRLVARSHIKIVTGKQQLIGESYKGEKNSRCGRNDYAGKIDFLAGNHDAEPPSLILSAIGKLFGMDPPKDKLQPLVKGTNLIGLFIEMFDIIEDLANRINENTNNSRRLASLMATHLHIAPGFGAPTSPADLYTQFKSMHVTIGGFKTSAFNKVIKNNIKIVSGNYIFWNGPSYINSAHVHTT